MKIFNSLTRQKQDLVTHDEGLVRMYSCGPTVYSYPHIGNMRAYLFMDALRRILKYNGLKIDGVMNITDVGHMTSDEDEGEDDNRVNRETEQSAMETEKPEPIGSIREKYANSRDNRQSVKREGNEETVEDLLGVSPVDLRSEVVGKRGN